MPRRVKGDIIQEKMTTRSTIVTLLTSFLFTCLVSCDDEDEADADADVDADGDGDLDSGTDAASDADIYRDGDIDEHDGDAPTGVIRGTAQLAFDLEAEGSGTGDIGDMSFLQGFGQVDLAVSANALAYETTDWREAGYVLFHVLVPSANDLNVLYLYCGYSSEESFDYVWRESYDVAMDYEAATGWCRSSARSTVVEVELEELGTLPRPESLVLDFTVDGAEVFYDGEPGVLAVDGLELTVYPFETVDCTTECTVDPTDGWWELHMVMDEPTREERCFGIIYLMVNDQDHVSLGYGYCLNSLSRLSDVTLAATWTAPVGAAPPPPRPLGPIDARRGIVLRPRPPLSQ